MNTLSHWFSHTQSLNTLSDWFQVPDMKSRVGKRPRRSALMSHLWHNCGHSGWWRPLVKAQRPALQGSHCSLQSHSWLLHALVRVCPTPFTPMNSWNIIKVGCNPRYIILNLTTYKNQCVRSACILQEGYWWARWVEKTALPMILETRPTKNGCLYWGHLDTKLIRAARARENWE